MCGREENKDVVCDGGMVTLEAGQNNIKRVW